MAKRLQPRQTNGYDEARVKAFVAEIEDEFDKLESEKGSYMVAAKAIRARIKDVYQTANSMGIDKAALKAVINRRLLERKIAMGRDDLEVDSRDKYDLIRDALGDYASTPLGEAASNVARIVENVSRLQRIKAHQGTLKVDDGPDDPPRPAA
jgi:uncharacterized protein (UPF0335 family)